MKINLSVIITGWNCSQFVKTCLESIKNQTLKPFDVVIVDDGSTDSTYMEMVKNAPHLSTVLKLPTNLGTYFARDKAINECKGNVIVMIDCDDYLLPNALELIEKQYHKGNIMTYGNYQFLNGKPCPVELEYSDEIKKNRDYRKDTFRCTHLRTFSKDLYLSIPKWELTQSEIESYPDVEILFSMMEMAGPERIACIKTPIYVYNTSNTESTLKRFGKDYKGYAEIVNRPKRTKI